MSNWVSELSDDHLDCRQWRHQWDVPNIKVRKFESGYVGQLLKCKRCAGFRYDIIDHRGEIVTRDYDMPDGYYQPKDAIPGSGPDMAELRLMSLDRRTQLRGKPRGTEASRFGRRVNRYLNGSTEPERPQIGMGGGDE